MVTVLVQRTAGIVERFPGGTQVLALLSRTRRSNLLLNLFSVSGGALVRWLIGLLLLGYAARVLGPEKYGLVGYGISVAAYASILLSPGLLTWGTREIARNRAQAGKTLLIVNMTQVVLAFLGYGALVAFALGGLHQPSERRMVLLCGLVLFTIALSADWTLNGLELMRIPAGLGVLNSCLTALALVILVRSPRDAYTYALIPIATSLFATGIVYATLLKKLKLRLDWPSWRETRNALSASLPLGVTIALVVVLHYANNLIVKAYLGMATLGIFLAAFRLLELATQIPGLLSTVFLPRLARFAASARPVAQREALLFAQVHMMAAFFIAAFSCAEAPAVIRIMFGARYEGAILLLRVMAVGVIFNFAICGYTNCLISFGQDFTMLRAVIASAVVAIGGGLLLVPRAGALGAALAVAGVDFAGWLVSLPNYQRTIGSLQFRAWLRPALGGGCIVAASLLMQKLGWPLWARIPLSAMTFVPFVLNDLRGVLR